MVRYPVWWRLCGCAAVAAVITGTWLAVERATSAPAQTPSPDSNASVQTRVSEAIAYVGAWEGRLAVFRPPAKTPSEVYDVFVTSLPPEEQSALAAGIPVYDEVSLQRLLEDYTG